MERFKHSNTVECAQAGTINSIQQVLEQLSKLQLEERQERRESEKRIITALEKVADQGARITNLENTDSDIKHDINILYGIQRDIEKTISAEDGRLSTLSTFYSIITSKAAVALWIILLSLVLIGSINDIVYHSALFTAISTKILGLIK